MKNQKDIKGSTNFIQQSFKENDLQNPIGNAVVSIN